MTWACLVVFIVGATTLGGIMYMKANQTGIYQSQNLSSSEQNQLKVLAIVIWVTAGIALFLMMCYHKRVQLAIAIQRSAVDFTAKLWEIYLLPLFMIFFYALFCLYWIIVALYIYSAGTFSVQASSPYTHVAFDASTQRLLIFHFIGFLWISEVFSGLS